MDISTEQQQNLSIDDVKAALEKDPAYLKFKALPELSEEDTNKLVDESKKNVKEMLAKCEIETKEKKIKGEYSKAVDVLKNMFYDCSKSPNFLSLLGSTVITRDLINQELPVSVEEIKDRAKALLISLS